MSTDAAWQIDVGDGPLVAAAIHDGHEVRPELQPLLALDPAERRREEDPFTALWTRVAPTRIVGRRSRFEFDLNRPRESAVYLTPQDAWGLQVWKEPLPTALHDRSLELYDAFHAELHAVLAELIARQGTIVVLDLHSYNHRRAGAEAPPADAAENPEVNIGTGTLDRRRFGPVVERFMESLRKVDHLGRRLDVRENVKFRGGHFSRWIHAAFPESACVLAIEFKKVFMDEWTGEPDVREIEAIGASLRAAAFSALGELANEAASAHACDEPPTG